MTDLLDREAERLLAEARSLTDPHLLTLAAAVEREHGDRLGAALAYALRSGGKRVRPALVLGSYRAVGGQGDAIGGVGAAVEVVHTYSLVHDDLPCMDDDAQRRGRPTTHVAFDVPTATRAGWLLVPVAMETLAAAVRELGLAPAALGRMAGLLLESGGVRGMVGGQWLDLEAEGRSPGLEGLRAIHAAKTGALIRAACGLGALAGRASADQIQAMDRFGADLGLAFQVADDVLDATATTAQLGKTAGRDAVLAKSTYVGELGIEGARREAESLAGRAVSWLEGAGLATVSLRSLARYIVARHS